MRECARRTRAPSPATFRLALAITFAATVLACTDGYPTTDAPGAGRAPENLVASLNALSTDTGDPAGWRYASRDRCLLEVSSIATDGQRRTLVVRLSGHWVELKADPETQGFAILLDPLTDPDAPELRVFSASAWRQASAASGLIQRLIAACKEGGSDQGFAATSRPLR